MTLDSQKSSKVNSPDILILGAGAAGLFCALTAGKRGRRVTVLEHNPVVGEKIRISGGGRCNFTNLNAGPRHFLSGNPDFCRSALSRFVPRDFVTLVEKHGIPYFEKKDGQLFCEESSARIIRMLLDECVTAGVDVRTGVTSGEISKGMGYSVETTGGTFQSAMLVVATGGLSIPKLGATDLGYRIARQFGVNVIPPRPGLVPLTLRSEQAASKLSGVSLHVVARSGHRAFEDMMLFTHKGISGPAVLQASSYWSKQETVDIDLLPHGSVRDLLGVAGRKSVLNAFDRVWPRRFAEWWIEAELANRSCNALGRAELEELEMKVHRWSVHPAGTEGFAKAEVTVGGVDTRELSSKTMETRDVKGLYFIGEVVDVTGWLGGYNFQWAWASGFAAGQSC